MSSEQKLINGCRINIDTTELISLAPPVGREWDTEAIISNVLKIFPEDTLVDVSKNKITFTNNFPNMWFRNNPDAITSALMEFTVADETFRPGTYKGDWISSYGLEDVLKKDHLDFLNTDVVTCVIQNGNRYTLETARFGDLFSQKKNDGLFTWLAITNVDGWKPVLQALKEYTPSSEEVVYFKVLTDTLVEDVVSVRRLAESFRDELLGENTRRIIAARRLMALPTMDVWKCYNCYLVVIQDGITRYLDNGTTPVCPCCGIDSLVDGSISDHDLKELNKASFNLPEQE